MKTALVAGGAGFLGSHMCDKLLDEGYRVVAIDNLHTGSRRNIAHIAERNTLTFEEFDILEKYDTECDLILNFACPASPPKYQADPINTMRVNFEGTLNLLKLARKNDATFIQTSTSEVYGDPEVHPQPESYRGCVNTVGPRACYDEGKRIAETLCYEFRQQYGVDTKIVRIFNTYGPRMDPNDGRVISNFLNQALRGHELTIYGDGSQTRSFTYVDDLIEGIFNLTQLPRAISGPLNLGSSDEFSIEELASTVSLLFPDKTIAIINCDLPIDDPIQRKPDLKSANNLLGWHAEVGLVEGLKKTLTYFEKIQNLEN